MSLSYCKKTSNTFSLLGAEGELGEENVSHLVPRANQCRWQCMILIDHDALEGSEKGFVFGGVNCIIHIRVCGKVSPLILGVGGFILLPVEDFYVG